VIRVYDEAGAVIETRERAAISAVSDVCGLGEVIKDEWVWIKLIFWRFHHHRKIRESLRPRTKSGRKNHRDPDAFEPGRA